MALNITQEVAAMRRMTTPELRAKWRAVFGEEARSGHREYLIKRIAWRLQALAEGDLSERARRRAEELASDADLRVTAPREKKPAREDPGATKDLTPPRAVDPRLPMPGAVIARPYKGQQVQVTVLREGFVYEGEVYASLSAIAKKITGTHWGGFHFFGLLGSGGRR